MGEEVELKLELKTEDSVRVIALLGAPGESVRQTSRYFDTPEHALAGAGLTLRVREANGRAVQTVKAQGSGAAGLFARPEWEQEVADGTPVLDATTPVAALIGDRAEAITPLFAVEVERHIWREQDDATDVEIALDQGIVVAGERQASVSEVEFELKQGSPAALFALARRIDDAAPVRLGVLSKAERGYRLLEAVAGPAKAERVQLRPGMTAAAALAAVAGACLRHFRLNEAVLDERRDPLALHQARVALRRLRSAFTIWKPLLGDPQSVRLQGELRWLAGVLGDARNLDVLIERAEEGELRAALQRHREQAYDAAEAALASGRTRGLMLDLAEWSVAGAWLEREETREARERRADAFAADALDRWRRRVKRDGRKLAKADDERRHEVRKDAKKLRYAAEFFGGLFPGKKELRRQKKFLAALEVLQDELGALNDMATAPEVLGALGLAGHAEAGALVGDDKAKRIAAAEEALDEFADARRFWR